MSEERVDPKSCADPQPRITAESIPVVRSEELLKGGRELIISHGQECYRLRLTRSGKLILGK